MKPTELLYLHDSYQFEGTGQVLEIGDHLDREGQPDGRRVVFLDRTILYPQGGGQPYDTGRMEGDGRVFVVEEVRFKDGIVHHIGRFEEAEFEVGQTVTLHVDEARRRLHAKLHSGGHLVDVAVMKMGLGWVPGKGYHFPDGAYVEYEGTLDPEQYETVRQQIETEVNRMIQEGFEVKTELIPIEQMHDKCGFVPDYIPKDKPSRIVTVYGPLACPCGGTHVKNINEIGRETIPKVKSKKGKTRVSYGVE